MTTNFLKLFLVLVCLAGFSAVARSQRLSIECKDRYFIGEIPTVKIAITNTGHSPKSIKEAEYRKFYFEMTGVFSGERMQKKKSGYDGSWYLPEPPASLPGAWMDPAKRPPKYVTLGPGESTILSVDLARSFSSMLGVSKYRLTVKSDEGETLVNEFEVYFDNDKSVPLLAGMLETGIDEGWAVYHLAYFNRTRFISLLEELASRNERRRGFATDMLADIRRGHFDDLMLSVKSKERYSLNESPIITILLKSNLGTPQMVTPPQYLSFSFELLRTQPNELNQDSKRCVYKPKETPRRSDLVSITDYDDSNEFSVNLQDCFGSRLEVGDFQLIVKSLDHEKLKYQIAVQKFRVEEDKH